MDFRGGLRPAVRVGLLVILLTAMALPAGASAWTSGSSEISTTSLDFGEVPIGSTSPAKTVTLKAIGDSPMEITGIAFYYADGYTVTSENCTEHKIPVGSTCKVGVAFTPTMLGTVNAALGIDDASGGYNEVALTGDGVETLAAASLSVKLKTPAKVRAGKTAVVTVTVRNQGNVAAEGLILKASGPARSTGKVSPLKVATLDAGKSLVRKIRIPVKKSAKGTFKALVSVKAKGLKAVSAKSKPISIKRR